MLVLIEVEENVVALAAWISGRSTGGSMTAVSGRARRHPSKNNRTHNDFLTFFKILTSACGVQIFLRLEDRASHFAFLFQHF